MAFPSGILCELWCRMRTYTMTVSLNEIILWKKVPTTVELHSMICLRPTQDSLLCPPHPHYTRNRDVKDLLTGLTWSQGRQWRETMGPYQEPETIQGTSSVNKHSDLVDK